MFEFNIIKKQKKLRTGVFHTPHGKLHTPELAFVATEGEIKSVPKDVLSKLPANLIITNTFHLWTKVALDNNFDIHNYSGFNKVVESDSGGFQVFSLGFGKAQKVGKIGKLLPEKNYENNDENNPLIITEKGVEFTFNGQKKLLTPEKSMEIQQKLGTDIMFAFDECTSPLNSYEYTKAAMERTHRWLGRCIKYLNKSDYRRSQQALFAIVQGGHSQDLRNISAKYMAKQDVPGFGIGGALGTTKNEVCDILDWTIPYLPEEKPRHLLGIGQVRDLFNGVERGVDLFDCVIPTREARHKTLYTTQGKINVRKMRTVNEVVDKNCQCQMCQQNITLYKLYELYKLKDPRSFYYATVHNIQFFSDLMNQIRQAINDGKFYELKENYFKFYP